MNRLMLSRLWKFVRSAVVAGFGLAIVVALLPSKARSQFGLDPCCAIISAGLNSISGLLRNVVAQPLGSIQQNQQQSATFEQQVVFPMATIDRARNMAVQFQGQFVQMRRLFQLPITSATLRTPQLLEQSLLSGNPGAMSQITSSYSALYGNVMPPANAPESVRNMVDMADAEAQAAMKKAVEIDALANLELQAAEQINQQLQTAAPGSSTILEAETAAWLVRANAYTQSAMAELVRLRSIELANSSRSAQVQRFSYGDASDYGQAGSAAGSSVAVFYFQQLLNTALSGIDGTAIIPTVTNFAFAILLIGFLIGLYQAAFRGGDVQALAGTAIKYLVVAMIVSNWATVFRAVNGSFNTVANFIGSNSGAGDMFQSWMGQLQQQFASNPSLTLTDIITGDAASTITVVMLIVAYLLYALAIIVFCFFYTLFGGILYVVGPLVLALIPIPGVGQLGKAYAFNVMVWNAWGILYAVFGALITAIQVNQVNNILGNGFLGFLKGAGDSVMLGLVSIFYALAIALIPFIAKRIISGDAGSTAYSLARTGASALGTVVAGAFGIAAGLHTGPVTSSAGGGSGSAGALSSTASGMGDFLRGGLSSAMTSNLSPPTPPSSRMDSPRKASGYAYRPHGSAQVLSYAVGRGLAAVGKPQEG